MTAQPITVEDPAAAVRRWFELMTLYCSTVDYGSARTIFSDDVASFGTHADAVNSLDRLQKEQWEQVWPRTEGFRVLMETVRAGGDANIAWGMATWESTGYHETGEAFQRRGRATVVLSRTNGRWLAVHTHFSLHRGISRDTFDPKRS